MDNECTNYVAQTGTLVSITLSNDYVPQTGDNVVIDFACEPPEGIDLGLVEMFEGAEQTLSNLLITRQFAFNFETGETCSPVLNTSITPFLSVSMFEGSDVLTFNLSLENSLPIEFYEGVSSDFSVYFPETLYIVYQFEDGAALDGLVLNTSTKFTTFSYTGETCTASLELATLENFEASLQTGETCTAFLSTSFSLSQALCSHGESLSLTDIDFAELHRVFTGECLEFSLAVTTTLDALLYDGCLIDTLSEVLTTHLSEPLGTFYAFEGIECVAETRTLVSKHLYCEINTSFPCKFEMANHSDDIDLAKHCCNSLQRLATPLNLYIDLANDPPKPLEKFYGDKVFLDVNLTTAPRFKIDFFTGETFNPNDTGVLISCELFEGNSLEFKEIATHAVTRLCKGNFIPYGGFVNVELASIYQNNCEADFLYTGEHLDIFTIQQDVRFYPTFAHGERLEFDLKTEGKWEAFFYTGEHFNWDLFEISMNFQYSTGLEVSLYEPPIELFTGEQLDILELKIEYDVEFLEYECLPNEYIYTDENGDPIPAKSLDVSIEGRPYLHFMKARCF